jgi:hypothetical protein
MKTMEKFYKVNKVNDWEYVTYNTNGQKLDEKKDGKALIKWPDGTVEIVEFKARSYQASYNDMGQKNTLTAYRLEFYPNVHGLKVSVDLSEVYVAWVAQ